MWLNVYECIIFLHWKETGNLYLKYDLFAGTFRIRYRYLIVGLLLELICVIFIHHYRADNGSLNLWDVLWNLFAGTLPYTKSRNSEFKLPVLVLTLQSLLLILSGSYVKQELEGMGQTVLILTQSRKRWWIGKVLWLAEQTLLYYGMMVGILCLDILYVTANVRDLRICNSNIFLASTGGKGTFLIVLLLIPVATSMVFLIIQNAINLCMGNLWGDVGIIISLISASYKMHPLLLGNNFMMLRNSYFEASGIIRWETSCVILIITGVAACIVGYRVLVRKDILNRMNA